MTHRQSDGADSVPVTIAPRRPRSATTPRTRSAACSACRPHRRRRGADRVLRAVRAATPRPGSGRHRGERRAPGPRAQGARARLERVHPARRWLRSPATTRIGHTRYSTTGGEQRAQHPAVPRRDDARPAGARPQRQHRQRPGAARRTAHPRLRAHRHQRHRGDDTDARRRRRQDVGGPHRAHVAGVEGCVLAGRCWPATGCSRCATRGASARMSRRPAPQRRPRRRVSETCALNTLGCSRSARSAPARSSRSRAPRSPPPAARPGRPAGALHVRVRLLQPSRQRVGGRNMHARPPAPRRGAGAASRPADADVVIPVPDSSIPAAIGYAREQRHAAQRRPDQEPLHRPHVHRADAGPARARASR